MERDAKIRCGFIGQALGAPLTPNVRLIEFNYENALLLTHKIYRSKSINFGLDEYVWRIREGTGKPTL